MWSSSRIYPRAQMSLGFISDKHKTSFYCWNTNLSVFKSKNKEFLKTVIELCKTDIILFNKLFQICMHSGKALK